MENQIPYTEAGSKLEEIYNWVISSRQPIQITREGYESVSLIPTEELNSLLETVYLFGSYENASRLLSALKRAKAQTNQPQTLEDLRRELGIEEASEKISA